VVRGERKPPGGLVLETERFLVHGLLAPSPIRGWLVLAPRRHARWWWELTDEEAAELGPLARRVFLAQRSALGAEHGYAFAIGDVLHHMHLHLIPRYADTPQILRGRGAFEGKPEQMLADDVLARAADEIARALGR
jgi:diadenosine tetraphosphate (Ap4A) HIT family hydrolase